MVTKEKKQGAHLEENAIVKVRDKDPVKAISEDRGEGIFRKDRKETIEHGE